MTEQEQITEWQRLIIFYDQNQHLSSNELIDMIYEKWYINNHRIPEIVLYLRQQRQKHFTDQIYEFMQMGIKITPLTNNTHYIRFHNKKP
jgi:hypothetical protein